MPLSEEMQKIRDKFTGRSADVITAGGEALGRITERVRGRPADGLSPSDRRWFAEHRARGVAPPVHPIEITDEERGLRAQVDAARAAYNRAGGAMEDARRAYQAKLSATDPLGRNADIKGIDQTRRTWEAAQLTRQLTEADLTDALRDLGAYHVRQKAHQRAAVATEIAERDQRLKAERRARGLPPLPEGETVPAPRWV